MVNKLFSRLQKPALWQRSYELIWDDEHISKGMLEAHLNPNWDAASRKHSYIDRSAKWLESIIPSDSDGNISERKYHCEYFRYTGEKVEFNTEN
jgi:hypothetical protein